MAKLTKKQFCKLLALWEAADTGFFPLHLANFIKRSVELVEDHPRQFRVRGDITQHLDTLSYLINLHVYKDYK